MGGGNIVKVKSIPPVGYFNKVLLNLKTNAVVVGGYDTGKLASIVDGDVRCIEFQ